MNKAPKKIWYDFNFQYLATSGEHGDVTQYIRADLVDGLVEALKGLQEWVNGTAYDKARDALKAIEEWNGN